MTSKKQLISHSGKDHLKRDLQTLSFELSQMIERRGGESLHLLFEQVLELSKANRSNNPHAEKQLLQRLAELDPTQIRDLIRSLACYFDLANIAEDRHRIRVLRDRERQHYPAPLAESIGAAIAQFKNNGATAAEIQQLLDSLEIELVFTAHPTEAKRATVRNTLGRLRSYLSELDQPDALPREQDATIRRMQTNLGCLWETDALRPNKPTVVEEIRRSLFLVDSLWSIVPQVYRSMRRSLSTDYSGSRFKIPTFLKFATWIGGDRDGNPFVTTDVTATALQLLRDAALNKHLEQVEELTRIITISKERSKIPTELLEQIDERIQRFPELANLLAKVSPNESYRIWLRSIRYRLEATVGLESMADAPALAYTNSDELLIDVMLIQEALINTDHHALASGLLQDWIDRINVFGFHLARLDIREDSRRLHQSIAELMKVMGLSEDYAELDHTQKASVLAQAIDTQAIQLIKTEELSEETLQTYTLFKLIQTQLKEGGPQSLGALIISMTHHACDILAMLWLSRLGAQSIGLSDYGRMPIVPLFETIDDLNHAKDILGELFSVEDYRQHVAELGDQQICMIGYSDSTKDGGYLAANWGLYQAQRNMVQALSEHGIQIMLFHGRGGAIGRGGGPAARGIMALPPESVNGKLRVTEQGEILAERYDDPAIGYRHLEQVTWATMLVTAMGSFEALPEWTQVMDEASQRSIEAYRELIQHDSFVPYFRQATPIEGIETMPIGSRPSRRRSKNSLSDLRAIPYTFAWTQSRHMLTAFYGLGSGLMPLADKDPATLQAMYQEWPFFRAVINNAELALVKAEMAIAEKYAALPEDQSGAQEIFQRINKDHEDAVSALQHTTAQEELLEKTQWLRDSLNSRNIYIDPLNLIQIELLNRLKALRDVEDESTIDQDALTTLQDLLRLSIQGVAAGMRTTG